MKKLLLVSLLLPIIMIAACGRRTTEDDPDPVTITYANWNLGEYFDDALERQMLRAFMDKHTHITVVVDERITTPWTDSLTMVADSLPDVFMVDDISLKAANGWLLDITGMAAADPDFLGLSGVIQEAVRIDGTVYALPFLKRVSGYFANLDLLREMGIPAPGFGVSAADFVAAAVAATDLNRPSIGLNQSFSFVDWYPGGVNPRLGFFAFDGFGYALNSPEMLEAVRIASELHAGGYTFAGLSDELARHFPSEYAMGAFRDGQMAFLYGGSWLMDSMLAQANFDWGFIGTPGGRAVVALEVIGISANTSHPYEAYLLAKWMGHGTAGSMHRLWLAGDLDVAIEGLPVSQNPYVLDELVRNLPVPGLREVYASMDMALLDGHRVMPGYMQARFSAPTGVEIERAGLENASVDNLIRYSIMGHVDFARVSEIAEEVARRQLEAAR